MKAVCWNGKHDVRVEKVPDPRILNPHDAILKITTTAICGSDLHLYNGFIPAMEPGDILGHEFMGEIVEVGTETKRLKPGDRVVVAFAIGCGQCFFCKNEQWSLCDNTNPNAWMLEKLYGEAGAGLFGYSHLYGGYAGGQAEYVRVPFADQGAIKIDGSLIDEQVLFLSDIFPTGYMAAENCNIQPGDTIAVWGCGPVGQFAIRSSFMFGASRVIAIDRFPERLEMARRQSGVETINYEECGNLIETLKDITGGRGPDACIDAVGMEAHGHTIGFIYDSVKQTLRLEMDRPNVLRQAIQACRKGGTVSVPGVYGGFLDKIPFGAAFGKSLTLRMGQTHVQRYMRPLLEKIQQGVIDPSFVISHRFALDDAPQAYKIFKDKEEHCTKCILRP